MKRYILIALCVLAGIAAIAAKPSSMTHLSSLWIGNFANTADVTPGDDDLYVAGTLEIDGAARFDGAFSGATYFTMLCHHEGQETATVDPICTFQMPLAATLVEVSVAARDIDTVDANETYTVDLEEAGTTVLSSAISITADNTAAVGTVSDSAIADNAKMELVLTLGGTTPAIDDLSVLLTFQVAP